jgi:hypothetical protein
MMDEHCKKSQEVTAANTQAMRSKMLRKKQIQKEIGRTILEEVVAPQPWRLNGTSPTVSFRTIKTDRSKRSH